MKKTLIALGLMVAASGAYAAKPTDGGGDSGSTAYKYAGNTADPTTLGQGIGWPSIFTLNEACRAEYGADARFARSSEIIVAIEDGSYVPSSIDVLIWPSDATGNSGSSSTSIGFDPHLNINFGASYAFIRSMPTGKFGGVSSSVALDFLFACSAPQ